MSQYNNDGSHEHDLLHHSSTVDRLRYSGKWQSFISWHLVALGIVIALLRVRPNQVIQLGDVVNYFDIFNSGTLSGAISAFPTEPILPIALWVLKRATGDLTLINFVYILTLLIYLPIGYAFRRMIPVTIVLFISILLLDYTLLAHLARQALSSAFILLFCARLLEKKKIDFSLLLISIIAIGSHNTALIFIPLSLLFILTPLKYLKIFILACGSIGLASYLVGYVGYLTEIVGTPLLGKAYYAYESFILSGESNLRTVSIIAACFLLIAPDATWVVRVSAGLTGIALAFFSIPIINARVGFIGTSLLTGVGIGYALLYVPKILPKRRINFYK